MSYYFSKIFVHLSGIAAICYFSIYKLIGWDPAHSYLSKVNNKNVSKKCEICLKLTIKYSRKSFWCLYCKLFIVFLLLTLNRSGVFVGKLLLA